MAETQNAKTETFEREHSEATVKNGNKSIDDSGIEMSVEGKGKFETNLALDCPWILGQLAWARGSSYPFWPCVVTQDPKTLLYYKVQSKYVVNFLSLILNSLNLKTTFKFLFNYNYFIL